MYTIDTVRQKLASDPRWIERAIVVLYEHQTAEEKSADVTYARNGVGFSAMDANRLSRYAQLIQQGRPLTGEHLDIAMRMVPKYARQITEIINSKIK
jgi:hypothetical protein